MNLLMAEHPRISRLHQRISLLHRMISVLHRRISLLHHPRRPCQCRLGLPAWRCRPINLKRLCQRSQKLIGSKSKNGKTNSLCLKVLHRVCIPRTLVSRCRRCNRKMRKTWLHVVMDRTLRSKWHRGRSMSWRTLNSARLMMRLRRKACPCLLRCFVRLPQPVARNTHSLPARCKSNHHRQHLEQTRSLIARNPRLQLSA